MAKCPKMPDFKKGKLERLAEPVFIYGIKIPTPVEEKKRGITFTPKPFDSQPQSSAISASCTTVSAKSAAQGYLNWLNLYITYNVCGKKSTIKDIEKMALSRLSEVIQGELNAQEKLRG